MSSGCWPGGAKAQYVARAQEGGFQTPVNSGDVIPLPTGRAGEAGFYTTAEFLLLDRAGRPLVERAVLTRPPGQAAQIKLYSGAGQTPVESP